MTTTHTEQDEGMQLNRWGNGLYVGFEIHVGGAEAVANDGIALGAALADLQREGWHLESLDRTPSRDFVRAMLRRSWHVEAPLPMRDGPMQSMAMGSDDHDDRGASA